MLRLITIALLSAWQILASLPQVHAAVPGRAQVALVIGNNSTQNTGLLPLRFADDDAVATHTLLSEAGVTALLFTEMDADTKRLHPSLSPHGPPRLDAIRAGFGDLVAGMQEALARGREVDFLLFYSGRR